MADLEIAGFGDCLSPAIMMHKMKMVRARNPKISRSHNQQLLQQAYGEELLIWRLRDLEIALARL